MSDDELLKRLAHLDLMELLRTNDDKILDIVHILRKQWEQHPLKPTDDKQFYEDCAKPISVKPPSKYVWVIQKDTEISSCWKDGVWVADINEAEYFDTASDAHNLNNEIRHLHGSIVIKHFKIEKS